MEHTFKTFGTMLDCSRNAVMTVDAVKRWIDLTAKLGCNTLHLYMEDTYEVDGQPYFGHLRGRYSKAELKQIDAYAAAHGMQVIPCIQTLAHVNALFHWPVYREIHDAADILLTGDERTYELVDGMFRTLRECLRTNIVNIGIAVGVRVGVNVAEWRTSAQVALTLRCGRQPRETKKNQACLRKNTPRRQSRFFFKKFG